MPAAFVDLNALDTWLWQLAINDSKIAGAASSIPEQLKQLGQPYVHLYVTAMFEGEVANGGLNQFFDNSSGALAPIVRDALLEFGLASYAAVMTQIIDAFGPEYPFEQWMRYEKIEAGPRLQELIDISDRVIDVWSSEYVEARANYATKNGLLG